MSFWITIYFFSACYALFIGWLVMSLEPDTMRAEIEADLSTWYPPVQYNELRWLYLFCSFVPILNTCVLLIMVKLLAGEVWDNLTNKRAE